MEGFLSHFLSKPCCENIEPGQKRDRSHKVLRGLAKPADATKSKEFKCEEPPRLREVGRRVTIPLAGLEACGVVMIFLVGFSPPVSCLTTWSVSTTHLAPLDTSDFARRGFLWADGICVMRRLRIARGAVVGQPGQLGIAR